MKIFSSLRNLLIIINKFAGVLILGVALTVGCPASEAKSPDGKITIVIDAGHGGHDVGAVDNGAREKDINFGVAKKLEELIKKNLKDVKTIMTRNDDSFVSLQERADIANRNHGDLFISIHTNSVDKSNPNRKKVAGASVYALGLHKDANNLQVARRENSVIELESNFEQKYSGFDPSRDESYIIFEMAQKKTLGQSLKFADKAQKQLVANAGRADRGVKQAGFWVLWATSMPAVLVELDFICNPVSAQFLNSKEGQEKMAKALYNAVEEYVASADKAYAAVSSGSREAKSKDQIEKSEKNGTAKKVTSADPVGKNKGKNKKSKKGKKGKGIPVSTDEPVSKMVEEEEQDDTPVVAAVVSGKKKAPSEVSASPRRPSNNAPRRRRSQNSRRLSSEQVFETDKIEVRDENAYLARVEKKSVKIEEAAPSEKQDQKTGKKNKKKKEKKEKNTGKSGDTRLVKTSITGKNGKKTYAVTGSGEVLTAEKESNGKTVIRTNSKKESTADVHVKKVTHLRTVYKIQILASKEELKPNDPRFCGLRPISCFKENGFYKYTYGESENRHDIEKLLSEVQTKIGDAFIITGRK